MWARIAQHPTFFRDLPWMWDGQRLWNWLRSNVRDMPTILTGLPYGLVGKMASKHKEQWCQEHLDPRVTVFCCGTRNKCKFSAVGCALIDDRGELREAWEEQGGIFIHHTSAEQSIKELQAVLDSLDTDSPLTPVKLENVCWDAQTPHGCFRPNCRFYHIPIAHTHRNWIRLWGFVWWNVKMFDDIEQLVQCVREVYPRNPAPTDVETSGAQRRMRKILTDCNALGFPFEFLGPSRTPIGNLEQRVLKWIRSCAQEVNVPGTICIVGSVALRIQVGGSDLDLVLVSKVDSNQGEALRALEQAVLRNGGDNVVVIMAATPVLRFVYCGLSVDLSVNEMGSVRDVLLFRYALTPLLEDVLMELKSWLKEWCIPGMKQGGYPTLVWLRMLVRYAQEQRNPHVTLKDFFHNLVRTKLPTGSLAVAIEGEQPESGSARLAANISPATFLHMIASMRQYLNGGTPPAPHDALVRTGPWPPTRCHLFVGNEVLTRVVIGVFRGPASELRDCECDQCATFGASPVQYVSRRSDEWLLVCECGDVLRPTNFVEIERGSEFVESDFGDWLPSDKTADRYSRRLLLRLQNFASGSLGYRTECRPERSNESGDYESESEGGSSSSESFPDADVPMSTQNDFDTQPRGQRQGMPRGTQRRALRCECQVFVRNLPKEVTEEDLFNILYCYEPIHVKICGEGRWAHAYMTFRSADVAQKAAMCDVNVMGKTLQLTSPRGPRAKD